jgi:hypothetical protein
MAVSTTVFIWDIFRCNIRGPFAKFVDSPYYSESELCGGAVTVSFSKYLSWQAMHFLQRSTHFSKTCYRTVHFEISCLGAPFSWLEKPRNRLGRDLNWILCSAWKVDRWNPIRTSTIQSRSRPMRFLCFSNHEKGAPRQEISKWLTFCSTFSKSGWSVVRSASLTKGGT